MRIWKKIVNAIIFVVGLLWIIHASHKDYNTGDLFFWFTIPAIAIVVCGAFYGIVIFIINWFELD